MMEELVKAIEKLSEKDAVDYLLIIVPILISLVAIFISVAIAIRQNKIAMFELRYSVSNNYEGYKFRNHF